MKALKHVFMFAIILVLSSASTRAQWIQTKGPYGGIVNALAAVGTIVFAGTLGHGIFRTTNGGESWTVVDSGLTKHITVNAFAVAGNNLYAGITESGTFESYQGGVFLSTDNGSSWTRAGLTGIGASSFDLSGQDLFACTGSGVYRTVVGDTNWTRIPGLDDSLYNVYDYVKVIAVSGSYIFAGTGGDGIYLSSDDGASWVPADAGLDFPIDLYINCFTASPNGAGGTNIYAGTQNGVFVSPNNGISWVFLANGLSNVQVYSLVQKGSNIYAGTENGVYASSNINYVWNWTPVNSGLTNVEVNTFALTPGVAGDTDIYAGTYNGIFLSTNSGTNWTAVNSGYIALSEKAFAVSGGNIFAGTGGGGVFLSTDNGASWTTADSGLTNIYSVYFGSDVNDLLFSGTDLFAATSGGVYLSANNGTSWSSVSAGLPPVSVLSLASDAGRLFAGTFGEGVYLSTDNGTSWTSADSGPMGLYLPVVYSLATSDTNLIAGTDGYSILLSSSYGATWIEADSGLTKYVVYVLAVAGTNLFAGTNGGVFLSTDNGTSWTPVGLTKSKISCFAVNGKDVFAGTDSGKVYLSNNSGASWTTVNQGLMTDTTVYCLAVSGTNLLAGTYGSGVWQRPLTEMVTGISNVKSSTPSSFYLSQNYPNPFNSSTVIRFDIPVSDFVTLKVYDVLGREMRTLVNRVEKPGSYSANFNAGDLPSGVYFYRLQAGSYVQTKKMILLK